MKHLVCFSVLGELVSRESLELRKWENGGAKPSVHRKLC